MKTELTAEQIETYQRDGCLRVEEFLTADELAELSAAVARGVEEMGNRKITDEWATHMNEEKPADSDDYYTRVFLQRLNIWRINATVKRYLLSPKLGQMLCSLAGIDGIRVWHDQTLQKLPWDNPTSWHIDCPHWSFHSPDAISIWIALDDATIQNGCMYYMPGSHKLAQFDKKGTFSPNMSVLFHDYPEFRSVEPVIGEMKAGSAGFHNGLTAHAAGPNMSPNPRRAMTCAYMPDGATYNGIQNILSDEYVATHKVGALLDDESQTPLVWKRN